MTALNTNTIMLAEGHAIDRAAVHEKRLVLDDLHIGAVLGMARAKAKVGKFVSSPDAGYFGSASASDAYCAFRYQDPISTGGVAGLGHEGCAELLALQARAGAA